MMRNLAILLAIIGAVLLTLPVWNRISIWYVLSRETAYHDTYYVVPNSAVEVAFVVAGLVLAVASIWAWRRQ